VYRNAPLILIVDDDPFGARILEGVLADQGYDFAFAESGDEALTKIAALSPDLALLDVIMPGMDGFEVCRRLRAQPEICEVPLVMVTELDDQASRIKGIEAGADDFISKPLNREELLARVRGITRLNRYRKLLAERARFEWMVETSADGYAAVDAEGLITYANPAARRQLGLNEEWRPGDLRFLDAARRGFNLEPENAWENWNVFSDEDHDRERYLVRPETSMSNACWLRCDVRDQTLGDGFRRIVRLHNVTDKVTAMREMRTFHSMLSHKLRTPLYQAQSGVEMLADEGLRLSVAEKNELLRVSLEGMRRLSEELLDILQYLETPSALEPGGEFPLARLPGLVASLAAQMRLDNILTDLPGELARESTALPERIVEWILWEILENSRKFHPGKTPAVSLRLSRPQKDMLRLTVEDDGGRIPPDQIDRVWDPYYQCEKRFTGEAPGMGLGLSMVAVLVWQAGGLCRIANREPGPGVVVEVTLPLLHD